MAADGLITVPSAFGPAETMSRLEAEVKARGMTVFAHVDHGAGAAGAGMALRPTDLLIFGAARGGTPLMEMAQTIGIDLPLKALVWLTPRERPGFRIMTRIGWPSGTGSAPSQPRLSMR